MQGTPKASGGPFPREHVPHEPPYPYDLNDVEALRKYAVWAKGKLTDYQASVHALHQECAGYRKTITQQEESIKGFEAWERRKRGIQCFEVGARVRVLESGATGVEAVVLEVRIGQGGIITYHVGWWSSAMYYTAVLPPSFLQLADDMLIPPATVRAKG